MNYYCYKQTNKDKFTCLSMSLPIIKYKFDFIYKPFLSKIIIIDKHIPLFLHKPIICIKLRNY